MSVRVLHPDIDKVLATFKGVFRAVKAREKLYASGITKYNGEPLTRINFRNYLVRLLGEGKIKKVGRGWEMVNENEECKAPIKRETPKGLPYASISECDCRVGVKVKFHPIMWRTFYSIQKILSKAYIKPDGVTYVRITGSRVVVPLDSLEVL